MPKKILLMLFFIVLISDTAFSEKITVGLINHEPGSLDNGYVLYSPTFSKSSFLIDKCGYVINKWVRDYRPGFAAELLPNGVLLRTGNIPNGQFRAGGCGGIIEKLDWEGNLIWSFKLTNENETFHHDIEPLPNGNILALCWDKKTELEATSMGRKPTLIDSCVWSEKILELRPIGTDSAEIVWEWKVWDHLVQFVDQNKPDYGEISLHPELININYVLVANMRDWIHCNAVSYNKKLDHIMLSSHNFGEIWIIDHSTTKKEAAEHQGGKQGKGGDLIYRWGNPFSYGHGVAADQKFFFQHSAHWIPEGYPNENCISVFNNERKSNDVRFSSVDIFQPPVDENGSYDNQLPYGPTELKWSYAAENPRDFYSSILSSAQQLSNGNVLICDGGSGRFFEINSDKKEVWSYINPVTVSGVTVQGQNTMALNQLFSCTFYPDAYSAFEGKNLSQKGLVENKNSNSEACSLDTTSVEEPIYDYSIYPNPTTDCITVASNITPSKLIILNLQGQELIMQSNSKTINTKELPNGIYLLGITDSNGFCVYSKIAISR